MVPMHNLKYWSLFYVLLFFFKVVNCYHRAQCCVYYKWMVIIQCHWGLFSTPRATVDACHAQWCAAVVLRVIDIGAGRKQLACQSLVAVAAPASCVQWHPYTAVSLHRRTTLRGLAEVVLSLLL